MWWILVCSDKVNHRNLLVSKRFVLRAANHCKGSFNGGVVTPFVSQFDHGARLDRRRALEDKPSFGKAPHNHCSDGDPGQDEAETGRRQLPFRSSHTLIVALGMIGERSIKSGLALT